MSILGGGRADFFGLDIGTTALRVVQLRKAGQNKKVLQHYGQLAIGPNVAAAATPQDRQALTQAIAHLVKQAGVTSKNVAANLPSSKVFTTVVDMARLSADEMGKTINYQANSFIPTPVEQSKVDWAVIGDSPVDKTKVEILLSSIEDKYAQERLDTIEAAGLRVVALEPDGLALSRALTTDSAQVQMVLDIGSNTTDLVMTLHGAPRLVRSISLGALSFIKAAEQSLGLSETQAEDYVFKFGLNQDNLEGRLYNAIIGTVDNLVSEIQQSIKFFSGRYVNVPLEKIIVTGGASTMPSFPLYIANKFNVNVEIGNSWRDVDMAEEKKNDLLAVSNRFAVAAGLAERNYP